MKRLTFLVALAVLPTLAEAGTIRVAVYSGPMGSWTEAAAQLNDDTWFDFDATAVGINDINTAQGLANYDAILLGSSGHNDDAFDQVFANAVLAWNTAGFGGVVTAGWVGYENYNEPFANTMGQFMAIPMELGGYCTGPGTQFTMNNIAHPVTTGVANFTLQTSTYSTYSTTGPDLPNGQSLATSCGNPHAVVVGEAGLGRSVFLGPLYQGDASYNNADVRSGDPDQLLEQALAWVACDHDIDADGDGVGDQCDRCEGFDDSLDLDDDGYPDDCDNCPDVPQPNQRDEDLDGYGFLCECDDIDPLVSPEAIEVCDGIDNDCDGDIDVGAPDDNVWYMDSDLDGEGDASATIAACLPPTGYVDNALDCDDADSAINTLAFESCDGVDNNCDGAIDEGLEDCDAPVPENEAKPAVGSDCSCDAGSSSLAPFALLVAIGVVIRRRREVAAPDL